MLPVGHRPIVENLVRMLAAAGIDEVVLGLGFKPEPFIDAFPDGTCAGVRLHYAVEPEPLDTAGAIRFAADHAGIDDTFVVVNGDVLTDLDVASLIAFHRAKKAEATIHLTPVDDPSAYGVVAMDADGRVEREWDVHDYEAGLSSLECAGDDGTGEGDDVGHLSDGFD
jgi:mannose-1-phosphate guanylyltransferase